MDRLQTLNEDRRIVAAIDLQTASITETHPDFPDGETLMVKYTNGLAVDVQTSKLVEDLLVRHAQAMAIISPGEGATAEQYRQIADHFARKTGYGA